VGVPQLHALQECYNANMTLKFPKTIIGDGGCSTVGDVAKALRYSDAVMLGSMLKGTTETPGTVYIDETGFHYKYYGGSASAETKGKNEFVEGLHKRVPFVGKVKYILERIEHGLQSAFSYCNATNRKEYKNNCEFVHISEGGRAESKL